MTLKKSALYCLSFLSFVGFYSCVHSRVANTITKTINTDDHPIAFPGAEGFGKYTTGGRGGRVFVVTNLNDKGFGSLREAAEAKMPRIVVFAVAGMIHLESNLRISGNVTIAGQSAPGDGICIADRFVSLGGDNIIIRFLRFRLGDKYQRGGMIDGNGGDDALGGTRRKNVIIDHCSLSWSTDEAFSVYAGDSTTLQWNLIAEPLNYSYHFEAGDSDYENHGYGAIWGGMHATFHHNLFAHCNSRTPRFNGIRHTKEENADYRNNVIYNWGHNNVYAGEGGNYNIVNNYYKPGPSTTKNALHQLINPFKSKDIPYGKWYLAGNYLVGDSLVSNHNEIGVVMEDGAESDLKSAIVSMPFNMLSIHTTDATIAYENTLREVGCIFPARDTLDQRIINDVKNGTGKLIDVQGGFPHGTAYNLTLSAWPYLNSGVTIKDSDKDGIPDNWEVRQHLDPMDASDACKYTLDKNYTNIEVFLNSIIQSYESSNKK